jgi:hypothetical protein
VSLSTADNKGGKKRKRVMPDIVWTEDEGGGGESADAGAGGETSSVEWADESQETVAFPAQQPTEIDGEKPGFDAYGILAVEQIASFEEIHRSFLFLVRRAEKSEAQTTPSLAR